MHLVTFLQFLEEQAVAHMNQRDLQTLHEQEERRRLAEKMDVQIKHWAAGKEGNMRALLSSLQHVLWPECDWEPVSLTDLITSTSVKKVYRKATSCVHPDKVQQKGATIQQKYFSEKVFDILKVHLSIKIRKLGTSSVRRSSRKCLSVMHPLNILSHTIWQLHEFHFLR